MKRIEFYKKTATTMVLTLLIISSTFLLLLEPTISSANAAISSDLLQYEWYQNMFGNGMSADPSGTCFNAGPAPNAPNVEWQSTVPGACISPVAFNGLVFTQDSPAYSAPRFVGSTYALDAATGEIVWKAYGIVGKMNKIDDTYMMIGSTCVKIADGSKVWTAPAGFSQGIGYIKEHKIFVSGATAWDFSDPSQPPTIAWTNTEPKVNGTWSPWAYGNDVVVMTTPDNFMIGVDVTSGTVLWTKPGTTSWLGYNPSYIDGVLAHGSIEGTMTGWNIRTGEVLWTYYTNTFYSQFASGSAAAYGMIYMLNQDTYLYAINATTGQLVWKAQGPGVAYQGYVSVADGKIYCSLGDVQYRDPGTGAYGYSEYVCLNAYTGEQIWSIPIENGSPHNLQCIAYGRLYIIPTVPKVIEGQYVYSGSYDGSGVLNEVWCIGDKPADWSMFLKDPAHTATGYGPMTLVPSWTFKTEAPIVSSPTIVNGIAYFGSNDHNVYAVDINTHAEVWSYTIQAQAKSSPAVVNGKLYTGADDGNVYCLDASSGTQLWTTPAGGFIYNTVGPIAATPSIACSPIVIGTNVYVGALDGNIYCLNANTGNVNWKAQTGGAIIATPSIVDGVIYVTPNLNPYVGPGALLAFDASTGDLVMNVTVPYSNRSRGAGNVMITSPTVADGMIFVRTGLYTNYAINASTGDIIWSYNAIVNEGTPGQDGGTSQITAMLYKYGRVYFNDYYGITCLDATNGSRLWHTFLSREDLAQGITYSYGQIYAVTQTGVVYSINAQNGNKTSSYYLGSTLLSTPTPYNGSLYLGAMDWNLYCFEEAPSQEFYATLPTSTSVMVSPKIQLWGSDVLFEGTTNPGLPVQITAIDPNTNFQDIATVTSDETGFFTAMWTPPVPGLYVVTATCLGSQAYLPSLAKTAFIVSEAATAAQPIEPELVASVPTQPEPAAPEPTAPEPAAPEPAEPEPTEPTAEAPLITTEVTILAAVAVACIIGIVAFLALRKRK